MNITEVRVRLVSDRNERLKAFCCMTIDGEFVVRDIKIIDGAKGLFVAMPSRKITEHCPKCGGKNPLRASYCNDCGASLAGGKFVTAVGPTDKLHADVAHPINSECRGRIQSAIIAAYEVEEKKSRRPGYRPQADVQSGQDLPPVASETSEEPEPPVAEPEGETSDESKGQAPEEAPKDDDGFSGGIL